MIKTILVVLLFCTSNLIFSQDSPIAVDPTPISGLSSSEFADIQLVIDESAGVQTSPADNVADRQSLADFINLFGAVDYGTDGPGSTTFGLSITPTNGLGSGLYAVDNSDTTINDGDAIGLGDEILLFDNLGGDLEGRANGNLYFVISNNGAQVSLTQSASLNTWHPVNSDHNDMVSLNGISGGSASVTYSINLVQTITDADGDSDSAVLNLTEANASGGSAEYVFNFLDDGPNVVAPTALSEVNSSDFADDKMIVDESAGQQANPSDNETDRQSSANFSEYFSDVTVTGADGTSVNYGTDGAGNVAFALRIINASGSSANGLGSGIYALDDTGTSSADGDGIGQGAEVLLFNSFGFIEGRIGSASGDLYFTVSNNGSEITLTQSMLNIWHDNTSSNNEMVSIKGLGGDGSTTYDINLVQTITDADGDSASSSLSLADGGGANDNEYAFNFVDDGPSIGAAGALNATAVLDESQLPTAGDGVYSASLNLASVFGVNSYGTDGAGSTSYSVSFDNTAGAASGLYLLDNTNPDGKGASIDLVDQGNGTVKGIAGISEVFTISEDANGVLTFEYSNQTDPANIWHANTGSHDDSVSITTAVANQLVVTKSVTDADGDTGSQSLDIGQSVLSLEDDGPTAHNDMIFTDGAQSNNVVLVIDRSGSMGNDSGVNDPNSSGNYTRMEVLQNSIEQLLTSYEGLGTLNVQIVSFAGDITYHGWFSADGSNSATENAMNIINSLYPNGSSDYDDALQLVIDSYTDNSPPSTADNTTLYFISDGNPNTEANKQATLDFESTWESFLNAAGSEITNSYAVGIGTGIITTEYLDVVYYGNSYTITDPTDPRFRGEDNTIIVEDFTDLSIVLMGTIQSSMGNVLDGSLSAGGMSDNYGTDGANQIIAFEHDGTVYSAAIYGSSHTITSADGGTFTFYFEDIGVNSAGDFDYTVSTGPGVDVTEVFTYTIQDADGDTASANLEICVDREVLAIEDVSFSNLNYYPSPVLNILYINNVNTITKTIFYDINGKKLLEEIHQSNNVELKVDKFKIGVYFLEVYSNNQTETLKIIKGE
jgi:hypothetical protein